MSTISTNYNNTVQTDFKVANNKPLTDAEIKAKVIEVQNENLKAIEKGLEQNSVGWGDRVKIKVPADSYGTPIEKPTPKDWENAVKNNTLVDTASKPNPLLADYFSTRLADFGDHSNNLIANKALLDELRSTLDKGISLPAYPIPSTEAGDIVRAFQARQMALDLLKTAIGNPVNGEKAPLEKIDIKVPAGPSGKPIKNPSRQDWIEAQKNNRWNTVSGRPTDIAYDYYGVKIDTANWRESYNSNIAALDQVGNEGSQKFINSIRLANGEDVIEPYIDVPNAGKIIAEVLAVLGPAYNTELSKANELREQMDSLKKKNDAITAFENTLDVNSAGNISVTIEVPKTKYVYDADGNKILDENGKPKTQPVGNPLKNEDWSQAAEFETVSGKATDLAPKYVGVTYSTKGDHQQNLSNNTGRFNNERSSVSSEMSKLSGQFDFRMGNAQTNLQNANKTIATINDMMMSIARGI